MKKTKSQIRRLIWEQFEEEYRLKPPTVGAVLDAIEVVQNAESEEIKRKELRKLEGQLGWKLLKMLGGPVGTAVSLGKELSSIYKTVKSATKHAPEKVNDPILDLFQVDPAYKEMLDDSIEFEFDKDMMDYLNTLPRSALLPDMTEELEKWGTKKI